MSPARRRALMAYVERVRDAMGLRHWAIRIPDEHPEAAEDALAQIDPTEGRYVATLRLGEGFWTEDREGQRASIVHEMLHIHHVRVTDAVRLGGYRTELGQSAYEELIATVKREAEYMTDALTTLYAPMVRLPPERWPR